MSVKTYDPKNVSISLNGIPLNGFADGTFLTVEREEDAFNKTVGSDGIVSRAKSNNRSGMATLTLSQTSPSNDVLSSIALADELDNAGVGSFVVKDQLGTTKVFAGTAWVRKIASPSFGKEIENREWVIDLAQVDIFTGGNS